MMTHPTEDEMVEAYYKPGSVTLHLEVCQDCRFAFRSIAETLDAAREAAIPFRGAGYGGDVWVRLQPKLPLPKRQTNWWFSAAAAAVLAIVFALGMFTEHKRTAPVLETRNERVLYLAMSEHMKQAQVLLTELAHVSSGTEPERTQARDMIMQNRILRQRALRVKDTADAAVLDELERVLLQVANSDTNLEAVRQRVEDGNLLFRIRISGSDARVRGEKL